MSLEVQETSQPLSDVLLGVANSLPNEKISLGELLKLIGEPGMLTTCMFLSLPFLVPVSIPGVSTVFGLLIVLISIGLVLNRIPWMPKRLLNKRFAATDVANLLKKGASVLRRLERIVRPRWLMFTATELMNRVNGVAVLVAGVLLMAPFGPIPFTNTFPALAVLTLSAGLLQRDGGFILAGYLLIVASIGYFSALIYGAFVAGNGIFSLFGR